MRNPTVFVCLLFAIFAVSSPVYAQQNTGGDIGSGALTGFTMLPDLGKDIKGGETRRRPSSSVVRKRAFRSPDGKRFALMIANASYGEKVGPLRNPPNDVALVATTLKRIGFTVMAPVKDATRDQILLALYDFTAKLKKAGPDAIGFFYYAGHGVAVEGDNYLVPVDMTSVRSREVRAKGLQLEEITRLLKEGAPEADHFVIFDACRNRLRGARGSRGFVPVKDRAGMLIAFSTAPGETADDGDGDVGPYAASLAKELGKAGQDHLHLFQSVKTEVYRITGGQIPWERNGLLDLIYLGGRGSSGQHVASETPTKDSPAASPSLASLKPQTPVSQSAPGCTRLGRNLQQARQLEVGMTFCDANGNHKARVEKIANRAVVFNVDGGKTFTCKQGELCGFEWPVKPLFRVEAKADLVRGIRPEARMLPR